ncbi:MAG: aldo/keto reductase [Candidatus Rokubacteria bacterium]|nr:aldo/keto reductase [Candidatus Rokubacteria bacterium]
MAAAAGGAGARPAGGQPLRQRPIPATGEALPVIGVGTWRVFDVGDSPAERAPLREMLRQLVAHGGRVVDSSPMYGAAESVVGDLAAELGVTDRLFLATKVWTTGREAGIRQMEDSRRRLRASRLDLLQVHNLVDWSTHLRTLAAWKEAGRVRYVGITHYTAGAYDEVERVLRRERLDFLQINYSLAERDAERRLLPLARERGVAVLANRPFAEGVLFRRVRGRPVPGWAGEIGCETWAQLFLKWILGHPAVTCVIPGTGRPEHLLDNLKAGTGEFPDERLRARIAAAVAAA